MVMMMMVKTMIKAMTLIRASYLVATVAQTRRETDEDEDDEEYGHDHPKHLR